jgi:C4-dicarboxylate transporter DctM subunit
MYFGIATPFEAAGYGVIGAFVITVVQRRLTKNIFKEAILNGSRVGCMMIFLVICGMSMTFVVAYLGIPQEITTTLVSSGMGKYQILIMLYVLWLILGAILEPTSMVLLTVPFLYSTLMQLGFDPIWLGVVLVIASEIAMITPPVGLNLFVLRANTDVPLNKIIMGSLPYVVVLLIFLVIITIFPDIATFLPEQMFKVSGQ